MPFPVDVVTTTVVGKYVDATGNPVKGTVTFRPDLSAIGEGVAVAPVSVRKTLDSNGAFSVVLPASVNTGLDPDFAYEVTTNFSGGTYSSAVYQIPVSITPVELFDLVPMTTVAPRARFVFPSRETPPATPQPGETYYQPSTGHVFTYDAVLEVWVDVTASGGGGGGTPTGPAGGSLAGTYPNPTLKANSVGTSQLADASVTSAKLSVQYVPVLTYNNDLATTAQALGDLEDMINGLTKVKVLNVGQAVPGDTPPGTVILRKTV